VGPDGLPDGGLVRHRREHLDLGRGERGAGQRRSLGAAGFSINCYFGDETWEYETRDSDDRDYYYQGREWLGSPAAYRYDFAPDGDDYFIDLSMSEYNGQFPYETLESFPASGAVSGTITAERCDTLATTPIFPR
jgi:hypothetical protein